MNPKNTNAERLLHEALIELGITMIPDTILSDLIEAIRMAGEQRGQLEAYDHVMQGRGIRPGKREARLAEQCRIQMAQIERLIRVNRFLFKLLGETHPRKQSIRPIPKAVKVFTAEPGGVSPTVK